MKKTGLPLRQAVADYFDNEEAHDRRADALPGRAYQVTPLSPQTPVDDAVSQLAAIYADNPQGLSYNREMEDVGLAPGTVAAREIGRQLHALGGMELMKEAHGAFRGRLPLMARNLEMVWDHVGNWQG